MKSKNLIWIGLGAVALYLYFRNKPKAVAVTPKVEPTPAVSTTTKAPTLPAPVNDTRPKPVNTPRPRPKDLPVLIPDKKGDERMCQVQCIAPPCNPIPCSVLDKFKTDIINIESRVFKQGII